ncbi:Iron uptake protein A1 precursor [Phycisphaerae bacterium RAS1]|nr:Iron uptake protein A1 precursor [Phycisphaerae bacterium RAS1]
MGLLLAAAHLCACDRTPETPTVVVYTSVDEEFARQIFADFEKASGVRVEPLFDTEAGKTTGLVRRLGREAAAPRCDVWWSSEILGTIELARGGVLEAYDPPSAADIPHAWRDAEHRWTAVAARARVLAFHTGRVRRDELPATWRELATPAWCRRLALANPGFGTTRGHVAAMFAYWGEQPAQAFLRNLRDAQSQLADGNSHAVRLVVSGAADVCLTDTDDVWVAQRRGHLVDLAYPALDAGLPAVWIPCTVALVRGGPHGQTGRRLVDHLAGAATERALAGSDSRNVPLRPALRAELGIRDEPQPLDYARIADALPRASAAVADILLR